MYIIAASPKDRREYGKEIGDYHLKYFYDGAWIMHQKALDAARRVQREFAMTPGEKVVDERARLLAEAVQEAVCRRAGSGDRGVKNRADLAVTRRAYCPAILVECGFLTNDREASRIRTARYQQALADGIAEGVDAYLSAAGGDRYYGVRAGGTPVADGK